VDVKRVLSEAQYNRIGGRSERTLTGLGHRAGVSILEPLGPPNDEREITVEITNSKLGGSLRWHPVRAGALIVGPMSSRGGAP
jgi:hypothetical protein